VYLKNNNDNNNNNNCDNFGFSIKFSTEINLLCIRISINITSDDRNIVAVIVTRCMFDGRRIVPRCEQDVPWRTDRLRGPADLLSNDYRSVMLISLLVPLPGCELVETVRLHPVCACINMFWHDLYLMILTLAVVVVLINIRAYNNDYCYYYYIGQLKCVFVRTPKFSIRYGLSRRPTWLSVTQNDRFT